MVVVISTILFVLAEWPGSQIQVIFCDVGQGDAILITDGFSQALVDTGRDDLVLKCLEKYLPFWDSTLELVVLTHPDSDHLGGMVSVLKQYQARYILNDVSGKPTDQYKAVADAFRQEIQDGATLVIPRVGQVWWLEKVRFDVWQRKAAQERVTDVPDMITETSLWDRVQAISSQHEGTNDDSIVLFGSFNRSRFLLTGDLEEEGELALVQYFLTTQISLLKAGHHGSKTSSIEPFITTVQPEKVVISSGKNNRYGHPAPEVLSTLEKSGASVYRTDLQGDLVFTPADTSWRLASSRWPWLSGFFCQRTRIVNCGITK